MFIFYKSEFNPTNLTGQVGGDITSVELSGYLGELFVHREAPPYESTGVYYQYRKIFVKNDYDVSLTDVKMWFDAEEHPGQISMAAQTGASYSIANGTIEPTGITVWSSPNNYSEGIDLGDLSAGAHTGVWLRQALTNISEDEPYASLRINIGGIE